MALRERTFFPQLVRFFTTLTFVFRIATFCIQLGLVHIATPILARFRGSSEIASVVELTSESFKLPTLGRVCARSKSIQTVKTSHLRSASLANTRWAFQAARPST